MKKFLQASVFFSFLLIAASCHHKLKERKDSLYSRHLQKHIDLEIINTPVPKNKDSYNLLLLNDGQDADKLRIDIVDSLYRAKLIQPLVIVAINAFDRDAEYGVAGYTDYKGNGAATEKYSSFIEDDCIHTSKK